MLKALFATLLPLAHMAAPAQESVSPLRDPHFANGFIVLDANPGARVEAGRLIWNASAESPVWEIAQWSSRHSLAGVAAVRAEGPTLTFADGSKAVRVKHPGTAGAEVTLELDSQKEWIDGPRKPGEAWPHLLLQQNFSDPRSGLPLCPAFSELDSIEFSIEARLIHSERIESASYDPGIHAAQFQLFFTVQNGNRASAGFGDFLWLGVPIYDDRADPIPSLCHKDLFSRKLIFTPASTSYTQGSIRSGEWVAHRADILAIAKEALARAWDEGFLLESRDLADYRLGGLNIGWEVPGMNRVSILFRKLRLECRPANSAAAHSSDPPLDTRRGEH